MSQLGASQRGRAEEEGGFVKGWVVQEMARGAVGRSESRSKGWVPTHVRRMLPKPGHNNASIMASIFYDPGISVLRIVYSDTCLYGKEIVSR